jgi:hypothetical protein
MTNAISTSFPITMTSLELVDFINGQRGEGEAVLRHDSFMGKVPEVLGEGVQNLLDTYVHPQNKQTYPCYRFPKREACLMAMSYSYDLQAKVFDKMTALEQCVLTSKPAADVTASAIMPAKEFRALYGIARLIGCDKNAAAISANQAVTQMTGTNVLRLLNQTHLVAKAQDTQYFTPTELGKRIGTSARGVNLLLAEAGVQLKRGEVWEVTDAGREFARVYDTGKKHGSGVPVTQIKWSPSVLNILGADEKETA